MPHSPGLGAIFGIVSENGVPVENFPVTLLDGSVPRVLRQGRTEANGGFIFNGLNPEATDYMVVVQDTTGAPPTDPYKNAQIKDRVQPVYVNLGTTYPAAWWPYCRKLFPAIVVPAPYINLNYNNSATLIASNAHNSVIPQGSSASFNTELTPFSGAYNLPVISLDGEAWVRVYSQTGGKIENGCFFFSLALVPSFDAEWGVTLRGLEKTYMQATYDYRGILPFFHIAFDGVDKIRISVPRMTSSTDWINTERDWAWQLIDNNNTEYLRFDVNITLNPIPTDFTFVGLAVNGSSSITMIVGDTEYTVANSAIPCQIADIEGPGLALADMALHGFSRVGNATGPKFAFAALFAQTLQMSELTTLKTLLFDGGAIDKTGYTRDITTDYPAWFFRLDEFNSISGAASEHFEGDIAQVNAAVLGDLSTLKRELVFNNPQQTPVVTTSTPIAGVYGIVFDGSYGLGSSWVGMGLGDMAFTISFWFRPDSLGTRMDLVQTTEHNTSITVKNFCIYCDTDSVVKLLLAGTNEVFAFPSPVEVGNWYNITFVVNKYDRVIRLFLNGVFIEEQETTATGLNVDIGNTTTTVADWNRERSSLQVGGLWNGSSVSNGLIGALSCITGFTYPVQDFRLASHYANRLVV